jgi:hypothetical protein
MQNLDQGRVHQQSLWFSHELFKHTAPQRFEKAPELPYTSVKRGRVKTHYAREQLVEKPPRVAQKRPRGFHSTKLLHQSKGKDLGVRESFERAVAARLWVYLSVSVVHETEQSCHGVFQRGWFWGMVILGHPKLLWSGSGWMALFLLC